MEIGIFGLPNDDEVKILKRRIEEKGGKATIINFKEFPANVKMYFNEKEIILNGKNLFEMHSFYIRQLGYFWPVPQIEMTIEEWMKYYKKFNDLLFSEREHISFKHSMIRILDEEKLVVNPYDTFIYHRMKPYQFYKFYKNNLPVPNFIAGGAKYILENFEVEKMVYKPLAGGAEVVMAKDFLEKNKENLEKKVTLFQDYICGDNIRVFVIEDEFIGGAKLVHGPQVDSRVEQIAIEEEKIPEEVQDVALKAIEILGMKFSGVDFIRSLEGEYYILECNPSPMFYVFEEASGIKVSEKIAEYLIRKGY
jgi:glutathione synthase/RimK-type ligase-like ATP-grasp enzyme